MATVRIGGANVPLPTFPGLAPQYGGGQVAGTVNFATGSGTYNTIGPSGYYTGLTNALTLAAGEVWLLPAGTWSLQIGTYTTLQWLDPVTNRFKNVSGGDTGSRIYVDSDGQNYRLANLTGCVTSAVITAQGTGGVATTGIGTTATGLTVTASSGASTWVPIVGGAISTTPTTGSPGTGYLYPPIVIIDAPPQGGLQATAICSLGGGSTVVIANVSVLNQGAGYVSAPNVTLVNDPRDTVGAGAAFTVTLTGTGLLTGLYPSNHGVALTGVPTLAFSPASSFAATAIMNFTVTGFTTSAGGSSYPITNVPLQAANLTIPTPQASPLNPLHTQGFNIPRPPRITAGTTSGAIVAATTTTGTTIEDGGFGIEQVPNLYSAVNFTSTTGTTATIASVTVGGVNDTSYVQPI